MKISIAGPAKLSSDQPLHRFRMFAAIALLFIGAGPAVAADSNSPDQWEFGLEVYLWAVSVGGNTNADTGIDVSFGDLLDDLQMGFMGAAGARKGKWSLLADVLYGELEAKESTPDGDFKIENPGWIVSLAGGYAVVDTERNRLDLLAGARYLDIEIDLTLDPIDPPGGPQLSKSGTADPLDAIIGVKGQTNFSEKWYLSYYLDIGTGDTDFTWQALAGLGYQFKHVDAVFGYRYLDWEFDKDDTLGEVLTDLNVHGPYAGVKWMF
jgi:hypothetical protein